MLKNVFLVLIAALSVLVSAQFSSPIADDQRNEPGLQDTLRELEVLEGRYRDRFFDQELSKREANSGSLESTEGNQLQRPTAPFVEWHSAPMPYSSELPASIRDSSRDAAEQVSAGESLETPFDDDLDMSHFFADHSFDATLEASDANSHSQDPFRDDIAYETAAPSSTQMPVEMTAEEVRARRNALAQQYSDLSSSNRGYFASATFNNTNINDVGSGVGSGVGSSVGSYSEANSILAVAAIACPLSSLNSTTLLLPAGSFITFQALHRLKENIYASISVYNGRIADANKSTEAAHVKSVAESKKYTAAQSAYNAAYNDHKNKLSLYNAALAAYNTAKSYLDKNLARWTAEQQEYEEDLDILAKIEGHLKSISHLHRYSKYATISSLFAKIKSAASSSLSLVKSNIANAKEDASKKLKARDAALSALNAASEVKDQRASEKSATYNSSDKFADEYKAIKASNEKTIAAQNVQLGYLRTELSAVESMIRDVQALNGVPSSCWEVLQRTSGAPSGVYQIDRGEGKFDLYCDMETNGGGWDLVSVITDNLQFGSQRCTSTSSECFGSITRTASTKGDRTLAQMSDAEVLFRAMDKPGLWTVLTGFATEPNGRRFLPDYAVNTSAISTSSSFTDGGNYCCSRQDPGLRIAAYSGWKPHDVGPGLCQWARYGGYYVADRSCTGNGQTHLFDVAYGSKNGIEFGKYSNGKYAAAGSRAAIFFRSKKFRAAAT